MNVSNKEVSKYIRQKSEKRSKEKQKNSLLLFVTSTISNVQVHQAEIIQKIHELNDTMK